MDLSQEKEGRGLELTIHIEDKCQNDGEGEFEKADLPIALCPLKSTILFFFLSFTSTNPLLSPPKLENNFKYVHIHIFSCKLKSSIIATCAIIYLAFTMYQAPTFQIKQWRKQKPKIQKIQKHLT